MNIRKKIETYEIDSNKSNYESKLYVTQYIKAAFIEENQNKQSKRIENLDGVPNKLLKKGTPTNSIKRPTTATDI
ncbi:hypothetical protein PIROE2DRAFT_5469 [Piromyces sp. E2]|nr:hypothetical protein PIROE2DRAFT_5469 [Piromyces sp. E2]|eukprot:OUM67200.1 hypothetical protein PIROE2DRAFT_5469 [Piromyces sp. E2]